jgi:hypothetical protein
MSESERERLRTVRDSLCQTLRERYRWTIMDTGYDVGEPAVFLEASSPEGHAYTITIRDAY